MRVTSIDLSPSIKVLADAGAPTDIILYRVLVLIALRSRAPAATYHANEIELKNKKTDINTERDTMPNHLTYDDNNCEDCHVPVGVRFVAFHEQNLFLDPRIAHCVEDGHSNPKPNVEGCEHPAKIAALFQARHTGS